MKEIKGFFGEYHWLSNFYLSKVTYNNKEFPSVEHAYQFAKHTSPSEADYEQVLALKSAQVKHWGKNIPLKKDWNKQKVRIMSELVWNKFENNLELKERLLELKDCYLEETNYWYDRFWGVFEGEGQNHLGKILMNTARFLNL